MQASKIGGVVPAKRELSPQNQSARRVLFAAAFLSFAGGAAGLAHQVLWTRRLVDVLGATSLTFSKVVGAFFLGLALGGWLATRFQIHRNAWISVAVAEAATAVLALPILWLPHWITPGSIWAKLTFALPLVVVTPPALLMGLVLPWLVRVFTLEQSARHATLIYAVNILGGIAGIVALLLVALPRLGTIGSGLVAIALNVLVASGAVVIGYRSLREDSVRSWPFPATKQRLSNATKALAFFSGFLVLASETILQHQFAQVTINSFFSNGTVLALVLLGLGLSALCVMVYVRWVPVKFHLPMAFALTALTFALQPMALLQLRPGLEILPYELPPLRYTFEVLKLGAVAIVPLFLTSGLIFPLIFRHNLEEGGPRRLGLLLAWNGVGGWVGAEFTQYIVAPNFGLWLSMVIIAAGYGLLAVSTAAKRGFQLGSVTVFGIGLIAAAVHYRGLPQVSAPPGERLVELRVSPDGVVATVESGPGDWRIVFNNSYTLGGSTAQFNQERQAHIPILLHGATKRVGVLGVATGSTTAGAAAHLTIDQIDAFELSPVVLEYARAHFLRYNRNVFADPRVRFFAQDARWGIAAHVGSYDVVIGDLFLPWRTGEGRLFTVEHFQNVRRSLRSGGLFCQWLPMFQLTRAQFESITHTFKSVFPEAFLVRGDFYAELPILGLVGGRELGAIDWKAVDEAARALREQSTGQGSPVRDALALHGEGIAMLVIGELPSFPNAALNTLDNGWLEWNAGQNILGLRAPWFVGVPLAEFVRDLHRANAERLPEYLREAHTSGQFFLTMEVASHVDPNILQNLKAQIPMRLPPAMRTNNLIDWVQWPSKVKPFR